MKSLFYNTVATPEKGLQNWSGIWGWIRSYSTGHSVGSRSKTIFSINKKYQQQTPITMITAYDYFQGKIVDRSGVDMVLVGDSLGMTTLGYKNTIPVTMDQMIHHCKAVTNSCKTPLIIGDMPFGSYENDHNLAISNAVRFMKEGNVNAIKLEGGIEVCDQVNKICRSGIPVMGHIGLTPQKLNALGGYRYQGKTMKDALKLIEISKELQRAGAFAIVLECITEEVAEIVTKEISIPTIGIGAGRKTSGQVLVFHDILGLFEGSPKFSKQYINLTEIISKTLLQYEEDVVKGIFPGNDHIVKMDVEELTKLKSQMIPI